MLHRLVIVEFLFICFVFVSIFVVAQPISDTKNDFRGKLIKNVNILSSDSMGGRASGTEGERKTKEYIIGCFKGLKLNYFSNNYLHDFSFKNDSITVIATHNLVGFINNNSDSTIIIGAHYDHLGNGGPKSRSLTCTKNHPGADDNASGVALMLVLAEWLVNSDLREYNYIFVAFGAHEAGLYGSKAFVESAIMDTIKIKIMLNLDMVGRLCKTMPILKVYSNNKDTYIDSLLLDTRHDNFTISITDFNNIELDATAFVKKNIPTLSLTTGTHDDYHKISDTPDKINYEGMVAILEYLTAFLKHL